MRYRPEHKDQTHRKIVKDASKRVRAEGLDGTTVAVVMRDAGLTHGGFYKHFKSREDLLLESIRECFQEIEDWLAHVGEQSSPEVAWKAIVNAYLSPEHCGQVESGCPLVCLAPELARVDDALRPKVLAELAQYRDRMLPFMPGRRTADKQSAFFAIFSTMIGAIEIARMVPDREARDQVLAGVRNFLLSSF